MHMAIGVVVNAVWDLRCRIDGQPLWRVLSSMEPAELVAQVDFTYIDDALDASRRAGDPDPQRGWSRRAHGGAGVRRPCRLHDVGRLARATTTTRCTGSHAQAVADGFTMLKLKVGATAESDLRRLELARDAVGAGVPIAVDANQRWGVDQAIERMHQLAPFDPYWIEEPTSPDDVLGHRRIRQAIEPIRVATGEHVQNRVIFKQLLQAEAIDVVQIDACRVGGVNENLAILLLAARVRRAGLPTRRRRRPVRDGAAPGDVRLRRRVAEAPTGAGSSTSTTCTSTSPSRSRSSPGATSPRQRPAQAPSCSPRSIDEYRFPDGPAWTP